METELHNLVRYKSLNGTTFCTFHFFSVTATHNTLLTLNELFFFFIYVCGVLHQIKNNFLFLFRTIKL